MAYAPPQDTDDIRRKDVHPEDALQRGERPRAPRDRDTAELGVDGAARNPAERGHSTPPADIGVRPANTDDTATIDQAVRELDASGSLKAQPEPEQHSRVATSVEVNSLHKLRRFIGAASLTSAVLLVVFALLASIGAVPTTVAVGLGTVFLITTAAFAHTWYDFRGQ